jgi:signal transduction histidine kinase
VQRSRGDGPEPARVEAPEAIAGWRESVFALAARLCFLVFLSAAVITTLQQAKDEALFDWSYHFVLWLGLAACGLATFRASWSLNARAVLLSLAVAAACLATLLRSGYLLPNPFVGLFFLLTLSALAAEARVAWALWGVVSVSLVGLAMWMSQQPPLSLSPALNTSLGPNWVRIVLLFAAISGAGMAGVIYLVSRLEQATLETSSLLDRLSEESQARITVLEEQRLLEATLHQSQRLESLGQFAGGVAHDFNNLLTVILATVELTEAAPPDERPQLLEEIRDAAIRGADLTGQLLTFARRGSERRAPLGLNKALTESMRLVERLLPAQVKCQLELDDDAGEVWLARVELDQLLLNLCLNARDAMPEGGTLRVRTRRERRAGEDWCALTVTDTGHGMSEDVRRRAFEPFYTTKDVGKGTGLGLSVVHGIVTSSGGRVDVTAAPGQGTTFELLLLPAQRQQDEAQPVGDGRRSPSAQPGGA